MSPVSSVADEKRREAFEEVATARKALYSTTDYRSAYLSTPKK